MPIRILDAATVGRIAAGEVVERPSSVVKELVENSLDAGATAITVEIRGGGIDYLRVTDNGCGIEPGQVRLAFENHATSKLQHADQLNDIRTLGFRGEALPSIASVSHVEMTTRAKNQDSGMKVNVDGGENLRVREAGCPDGTTFVMKDLFYNIPVRRAFLKKPGYEGGLVADAMARLMIGNPGVSMRFINNGNTVYHSFGDGKLRHAIFAVYGKQAAEKMIEMDAAEGGTRVYGMIGVGELAKSTRSHQMFFINGRSVRCALLSKALERVCKSRVTIGMYPMCALNLVLPPNAIDVNVHPNKLEVRFRDEVMTQVVVEKLLESAFTGEKVLELKRDAAPVRELNRVSTVREISSDEVRRAAAQAAAQESMHAAKPQMPPLPGRNIPESEKPSTVSVSKMENAVKPLMPLLPDQSAAEIKKPEMPPLPKADAAERIPLPVRESLGDAKARVEIVAKAQERLGMPNQSGSMLREDFGSVSKPAVKHEATAPAEKPEPEVPKLSEMKAEPIVMPELAPKPEKGPDYRIIGVAFKTYIMIEVVDTLLLIDQHAAHERLQYEKYMKQLDEGTASQQLLAPIVLRLSAREMALIQENMETLTEAGYSVEPFGEHDIQVRAVPHILGKAELKPLFMDMINSLNKLKAATVDARRAQIMQMACKSAVKGGDALTDSEISALIREMMETGAPPTCPHGRPVVKSITRRDLEKLFKRIQ